MVRLLIALGAAIAAAVAAVQMLPGAAPFLAGTSPAVLGAIAALATLVVVDQSMRALSDDRTASLIRRLAAKSDALEFELAALRAGAPLTNATPPERPVPDVIPEPAIAPSEETTPPPPTRRTGGPLIARSHGASPRPRPATAPTIDVDHELLASVREALRGDQIALHLQPIIDLADRHPAFYECFSRLRTSTGTLLTPQTYLPVVEAEGLTAAIDNMLLLRCVQQVRSAHRRDQPMTIFCNISGFSLDDRVFFADFLDFAADNALMSNHLVFEIEHKTLAGLPTDASRDLRALADLGYRFAIDNANLGSIDAAMLTEHRVAFVKARTADIAERASRDRHLIDLERPLLLSGADLIATHIERDAHLALMNTLPVKFGQGFLLGEPVPIETLQRG